MRIVTMFRIFQITLPRSAGDTQEAVAPSDMTEKLFTETLSKNESKTIKKLVNFKTDYRK